MHRRPEVWLVNRQGCLVLDLFQRDARTEARHVRYFGQLIDDEALLGLEVASNDTRLIVRIALPSRVAS